MHFSPSKLSTIENALRVAAEQYRKDETECRACPGHDRVADAFKAQASEALALAEEIANA